MTPGLACAAIVALGATLTTTPAVARHPSRWIEQSVGQEVFNLSDTPVGRLERYIDINGVPGAVVLASVHFGGHPILVAADDLGWRARGGLLLALSNSSTANLPHYHPGWALPIW